MSFALGLVERERRETDRPAGDHGFLRGKGHLFVHRDAGLEGQAERDHKLPPEPAEGSLRITGVLYHV